MKVLFISAIMPYPLYSGGQVRVYNLLSRLGKSHEITLVTFLRSPAEKQYERDLSFCKKIITGYRGHAWQPQYVIRSLFGALPLLLSSYVHRELRSEIATELAMGSYDLVHIEPWYVWPSIPSHAIPMVVATHNIEYPVYAEYVRRTPPVMLRPGFYWDVVKLAWWEEHVWTRASRVVAVSNDDARVIAGKTRDAPLVSVVPNGVDVRSFRFKTKKTTDKPAFLFVGSFTWIQNRDAAQWLVRSIWPNLRSRYPAASLRIVGRAMPPKLKNLVASSGAMLLEHVENIEDELHRADILIAPIRLGGGTSFKILEAMASGTTVATTTLGAAGIGVTGGRELMIGDSAETLVEAVQTLMSNPRLRSDMAKRARAIIERDYVWDTIAKHMERVWYETAKQKR